MAILYDIRGNPFNGNIDSITNETIVDARPITATLSALNAENIMDLNGAATVAFDLRTAAGSMTISFEGTVDGTNYVALPVIDQLTQSIVTSIISTTTLARIYLAETAGFRRVRARVSAFTSGTMVTALRGSNADYSVIALPYPTTTSVSVTAAANTGVTATLAAGGVGLYHYITGIEITRNATAALAGTATLVITTTNIPGSLAWSVGNAMNAGGTQWDVGLDFSQPLKATAANTATTIVCPVPGLAVLWRVNVYYYLAA